MEKIIIQDWNPLNWRLEKIPAGKTVELHLPDAGSVSDGFHTFDELYEHRTRLYVALCRTNVEWWSAEGFVGKEFGHGVWRSKTHSDGSPAYDGWFIMGICKKAGEQISYHLPISWWDETNFAETLDIAPEWDGHTSADVLERLKNL